MENELPINGIKATTKINPITIKQPPHWVVASIIKFIGISTNFMENDLKNRMLVNYRNA